MDRNTGISSYLLRWQGVKEEGQECRGGSVAAVGYICKTHGAHIIGALRQGCCNTHFEHSSPSWRLSMSFSCCSRCAVTCALRSTQVR